MIRRLHLSLLLALSLAGSAQAATEVEVYKSPTCGCCTKWVDHLKQNGFAVKTHDVPDVGVARRQLGMPERFASCHTAKVGGYLLEGHVPAADIERLLRERPKAMGLAVPGMPAGSPGMDLPNSPPFATLIVQPDGSAQTFARH